MKISKLVLAPILLIGLTIIFSIPAVELKQSFLGPMIGSCPSVYFYFVDIIANPAMDTGVMQDIWDCGIRIALYLVLPGLGLSWIITKHILK